jgi:hypothetical protein
MVSGSYRDLFVVIATAAATLIGLLFVALSVAESHPGSHPRVVRQFRAAASFVAFINALAVTLFGLVPGTNVGIPALVLGLSGILFTGAGIRRTFEAPAAPHAGPQQPVLITLLLLMFGFQAAYGIVLLAKVHDSSALGNIGDILIVSLLIGIARAWEVVGEWNTGIWASVTSLLWPSSSSQEVPGPGAGDQPGAGDLDRTPDDRPE